MKINKKEISEKDLFFWVEEGQASLGNFETALQYIKTAHKVNADGIEFQLAIPDEFYVHGDPGLDHYKKIQYSNDQIKQLIEYTKKLNICFIATVLSESLVPKLLEYGCDAFVINASDINNPGIIDSVIHSKIPFFISLPLATEDEIEWIVNRCVTNGAKNFALMHGQHTMASGEHGVMPEDSNLGYLKALKGKYGLTVGYIDHSTSTSMPAVAMAAGANFISKHIVLNREDRGPDWFVCQEPEEIANTISFTRKINKSLNVSSKILAPGEHLDKTVMRRSIVAERFIAKGTVIKRDMIAFKRPGHGIAPYLFEKIIGKVIDRDLRKDEVFTLEMFDL